MCVTEDQFIQVFSPGSMPASAGSVTSPPPQNPPESETSATSTPTESVPLESVTGDSNDSQTIVDTPEEPASDGIGGVEDVEGSGDAQPELEGAAAPVQPPRESAEVTSAPYPTPVEPLPVTPATGTDG